MEAAKAEGSARFRLHRPNQWVDRFELLGRPLAALLDAGLLSSLVEPPDQSWRVIAETYSRHSMAWVENLSRYWDCNCHCRRHCRRQNFRHHLQIDCCRRTQIHSPDFDS